MYDAFWQLKTTHRHAPFFLQLLEAKYRFFPTSQIFEISVLWCTGSGTILKGDAMEDSDISSERQTKGAQKVHEKTICPLID
jgi:hypothetical protein